jgi:shikimate kinase
MLLLWPTVRGMNLTLKKTPGLWLVGFMGSGKSTIGALLAQRLGWRFVDLDQELEAEQGRSITDIFAADGEAAFRDMEHAVIQRFCRRIAQCEAMVLSTGGGAFSEARNRDRISSYGLSIWLDCPLPLLEQRVAGQAHRPLARDLEKFRALHAQRAADYAQANYRIVVDEDDAAANVEKILALQLF